MEVSPIQPTGLGTKDITNEQIDAVKKLLGVECLFIVVQKDKHVNCKPETCDGHYVASACDGFTKEQLVGLCKTLMMKLAPGRVFEVNL